MTKHTYELNLVLREAAGERITLLVAYGRKKINRLAEQLGEFLGLPLWDHVGAVRDFCWMPSLYRNERSRYSQYQVG